MSSLFNSFLWNHIATKLTNQSQILNELLIIMSVMRLRHTHTTTRHQNNVSLLKGTKYLYHYCWLDTLVPAKKFRSNVTKQIAVSLGLVWTVGTIELWFLSTFVYCVTSKCRFVAICFSTFTAMKPVDRRWQFRMYIAFFMFINN